MTFCPSLGVMWAFAFQCDIRSAKNVTSNFYFSFFRCREDDNEIKRYFMTYSHTTRSRCGLWALPEIAIMSISMFTMIVFFCEKERREMKNDNDTMKVSLLWIAKFHLMTDHTRKRERDWGVGIKSHMESSMNRWKFPLARSQWFSLSLFILLCGKKTTRLIVWQKVRSSSTDRVSVCLTLFRSLGAAHPQFNKIVCIFLQS